MLRIEKLFLQGFKSFCDPTDVVFDEKGITAVVGPNGCGKSNLAEALSWVIGEQRAKMLRGGKMEDVIFQGSRNRQPSGMAEVILTMVVRETFEIRGDQNQPENAILKGAEESLEQADAAFEASAEAVAAAEGESPDSASGDQPAADQSGEDSPEGAAAGEESKQEPGQQAKKRRKTPQSVTRIFHEGERITIGRRLYRSGESEYEMNGRSCRLRDIQDLFAGTGLGAAHYAIIEQGRIGQVLSAKPLDRRALIEEAAGISKFKLRQHAAELKLEASKGNLSRITDILAEVERQQNSLKRQAARARRYQRLRQEMRDVMRAVYVVDFRAANGTLIELESGLGEVSGRETEIISSIAGFEEAQGEAVQTARSAEDALNEIRQTAASLDLETERARQQHSHLNGQLHTLMERSDQFARDQETIGERRQFIDQEAARLREELQKLEHEINSESKTLSEAEDEHRACLERDTGSERKLEEARKKVYENVTHLERWRQLKRQFTDSSDRARSRANGLNMERERATAQAQAAQDRHAELAQSLEESSFNQQRAGAELSETSARLADLRRVREERQGQLSVLQRDLTAAEHRLKSLRELDQRRAHFSEAVQALSKRDPQLNGFKTLGTLADFVQVSPEHEAMIEIALRDELQYVVVPTFDDALRAIEFLKVEDAGRATFLVIGLHGTGPAAPSHNGDGHHPQNGDGPHYQYETLDSLLGLRTEFADAFKLALPGLAKARVVADANQAISASFNGAGPSTSLSFTGERVVAGRLISGGSHSEKGIGVLALRREIGELAEQMNTLSISVEETETSLNEIKTQLAQCEETRRSLDDEIRQIDKRLAVLREQVQQCERERERTTTHIRVVEQEMEQANSELQEFESKLEHAGAQTEEAEVAKAEAEKIVDVAQAEMAELRRHAEQRSQDLSRRRAEFAAKTERRRGSINDIRRLENETGDLNDRLNRSRMAAVESEAQADTTRATIENLAETLHTLVEQQQQRAVEVEARARTLFQARETLEEIELKLRSAREGATLAREDRAKKEIEKARLTSTLDHLIHSCHMELGENIVEVCERLDKQPAAVSGEERPVRPAIIDLDGATDEESEQAAAPPIDEESFEISFWNVPEDFDLESARVQLEDLRSKIDGLGPVNMMALEELAEVEERFHFLTAQKSDIEKAIADTQSAIAEIKKRSREKFQEAFYAINENFKQMFLELFGGGHGEMRLIDETDVLESGIEIIAQPPGKRLQNVLLLSGGEKAMTAISLVMAIFKYRPSPFCLLDEVDAPLDDVNIGRYADKILEMSAQTQFMVITHSKRTMEAARSLYGVTMEDPGVSKLISVKFA
ncbi:MAG TPA: chromosome segregation protein SMC [Blastocatellia bacterium]|nr:chromosome segregation protein SMC [Blastocatellia bacterium]